MKCPKCLAGQIPCPDVRCAGHWPTSDGPCDNPSCSASERKVR